jgi:hypothetical protein
MSLFVCKFCGAKAQYYFKDFSANLRCTNGKCGANTGFKKTVKECDKSMKNKKKHKSK